MNTSPLKSFAPAVRRQLLEAVTRKLDYVLTADRRCPAGARRRALICYAVTADPRGSPRAAVTEENLHPLTKPILRDISFSLITPCPTCRKARTGLFFLRRCPLNHRWHG
jgi:hypothetical protein